MQKIDLTGVEHHPSIIEITDVLCKKTENTDRNFFHIVVAYKLAQMASCMRAVVQTKDRGDQPVNFYAIALATSGYGKGYSIAILEREFTQGFRRRFLQETMPVKADENLWAIANQRALLRDTEPQEEYDRVDKEYRAAGSYLFTFDEATVPAVKQLRHKLILAAGGALNFQVDEIGSNLEKSQDMLTLYFELYDQGEVKDKLIKNSEQNQRVQSIEGRTPANMLLFGTPAKLFDGGKTEEVFYSLLETGYARRSLFAFGRTNSKAHVSKTPEEIYEDLINPTNHAAIEKWSNIFTNLADLTKFGWTMTVPRDVAIQLIAYKSQNEAVAATMKETQAVQRAEREHRHNKALKIAGAYAFVDGSNEIKMSHLMSAILLVEESAEAFNGIMHQDKAHVRLAKWLADVGSPVTQHDILEACPYYTKNAATQRQMMSLAISYGHTHNIIVKKSFSDNVEFFEAETLKLTNLDELELSHSDHYAYNYGTDLAPFNELENLATAGDENGGPLHWCNHAFKGGHRSAENVIPGFNMVVVDVDGGTPLATAHELLKDYKFFTYTTKRHQSEGKDRYRLILPMSHRLSMNAEEYKGFMNNLMMWLPVEADEAANQRERKWETNPKAECFLNEEGELLDVLRFIPRTRKNEQFREQYATLESLDNMERWFAGKMVEGNRNNHMLRFALALVDSGMDLMAVNQQVHSFNLKLGALALDKDEIDNTIMRTVSKRISEKE